ncbi:hypothetical protein AcetOrient_orf02904 [Acetobacter orientalis]|uniref:Uncharacterized protein n=1 Tax=Acetobacter orientalis TaxID=146474 RepID=A0A2Z5ZHR5_9PROT|nr:hypothetical protein AcetOrient_orf02904 [Acetobacter orientalis]
MNAYESLCKKIDTALEDHAELLDGMGIMSPADETKVSASLAKCNALVELQERYDADNSVDILYEILRLE